MSGLSWNQSVEALGGRLGGLGEIRAYTAAECWNPALLSQDTAGVKRDNNTYRGLALELETAIKELRSIQSGAEAVLAGPGFSGLRIVRLAGLGQGFEPLTGEEFGGVLDRLNVAMSAYNEAMDELTESWAAHARGYRQSGMGCPYAQGWAGKAEEYIRKARQIVGDVQRKYPISGLRTEVNRQVEARKDEEQRALRAAQEEQRRMAAAAEQRRREQREAEAAAGRATEAARQAELERIRVEAEERRRLVELELSAQQAEAERGERRSTIQLQLEQERLRREAERAAAAEAREAERQAFQLELERARAEREERRFEREAAKEEESSRLELLFRLLEAGVVRPEQVAQEVAPGLPTGPSPAAAPSATQALAPLPPGYAYVDDTTGQIVQGPTALPASPFAAGGYGPAYPPPQAYGPSYGPYAGSPSGAAPYPYAAGPAPAVPTPPPIQEFRPPSPSGIPGLSFDTGFAPGGELFGMSGLGGVRVRQGYRIDGPNKGRYTVTRPDGSTFGMSMKQAHKPNVKVSDPETGELFYEGLGQLKQKPGQTTTTEDIAASIAAITGAVAPLAQTGVSLAAQTGAFGDRQFFDPNFQEQQRQRSGWLLGALGLAAVGGLIYATRK